MLSELLSRGYFPKELPAPFVTESFASLMTTGSKPADSDFGKLVKKGEKIPKAKTTKFSHARGGLLRRQLSLCNPVSFYLLSREIVVNWKTISEYAAGTPLSATAPEFKATGRAINGKLPQSCRANLAQKSRLGRRFVLTTDISRFYHSVYTHSIPWALHTKALAKKDHSFGLLGNRLDFLVRQGQDGQTVGIPIGPDTSLVLAELIMQRCDDELIAELPSIRGHRFIDDYELSFATRTEAEDAFHILGSCLAKYEIALNPKKTSVSELPMPLGSPWSSELKKIQFRTSVAGQAADLEGFFSRAFELHHEFKGEPVLQFAVARLRYQDIHSKNWKLFQRLVLLCALPEPATFPYVLEQIISRVNRGAAVLKAPLEEIVNVLVVNHASLRHSSEVANALWACLALKLTLHDEAVDALAGCEDSCVALLALDCRNRGLLAKTLDTSIWEAQMSAAGLYDEHWLLAYEANFKGWLPDPDGKDYVMADSNFGYLKTKGVFFYDERLATSTVGGQIPMPKLPSIQIGSASRSI
ncbi:MULTISPECIES: RNA-directed DNA polymerase [Marinobacter]|uniref:RNA-directed DNA polymerase n=1 Tax=Marinobacter TaxID=2742 RepID=UPI001B08A005|nr:RNA-directed DNA polymerase [Marinobacter sp.]MBO6810878.1 RNA-directed DNA polymerase [Marinobacter sp.]MBO6872907.1 RNA-directed DNA polymerase [Marinobacter sp.]